MTTNAKTRTCRYCGRDLPVDDFPVKPGHVRARYKECAECHELGHSCVHKEKPKRQRRKYATAEERLAATKEYQRRWREAHRQYVRDKKREKYWRQKGMEPPERKPAEPKRPKLTPEERKVRKRESSRRWNEAHRDYVREYQRKRYYLKKGVEPPERSKINEKCANPKPKRAKLTPEEKKAKQREYQRRYYHEHKKELNARSAERIKQTRKKHLEVQNKPVEKFLCTNCNTIKPVDDFITDGKQNKDRIKARRCESSGTPTAILTDKRIVMLFEKGYSPNDIASRCMVSVERVKQVIEREGCRAGDARLCCDCWLYPCFEGMDSISTNLALTCQKYHRKEAAS